MDTDCGMPWDMASLGELREQVTALGEKADRNGECICLSEVDIAAVAKRVETLERSCVVSVHEGRLPLNMGVDVAKPAICSPLTKMGLTAVTDAQFREMAVYVSDVLYSKQTFRAHYVGQSESEVIADALQAYAKGAR
tara:strand:+ start:93 stop:506 length:414 start_codon:yes stop_codon:yes gene_type:complete